MHANISSTIAAALEKPYQLTAEQIQFYQQNRYIKLKQVFNEETISFFNDAISKRVAVMNDELKRWKKETLTAKPFCSCSIYGGKMKW